MNPQRAQRWPVVGFVVRFCRRWGVLTHYDEPGTLSWPGVGAAAVQAAREALVPPTPAVR